MSPGHSEGAPGKTPLVAANTTATKQKVQPDPTTAAPSTAVRHVLASTFRVTARSGRERLVLVVQRCPFCKRSHLHQAPVGFELARRGAGCGQGQYVVVALAQAVAA